MPPSVRTTSRARGCWTDSFGASAARAHRSFTSWPKVHPGRSAARRPCRSSVVSPSKKSGRVLENTRRRYASCLAAETHMQSCARPPSAMFCGLRASFFFRAAPSFFVRPAFRTSPPRFEQGAQTDTWSLHLWWRTPRAGRSTLRYIWLVVARAVCRSRCNTGIRTSAHRETSRPIRDQ